MSATANSMRDSLIFIGRNAARTYAMHHAGDPRCPVRDNDGVKITEHPGECIECAGHAAANAVLDAICDDVLAYPADLWERHVMEPGRDATTFGPDAVERVCVALTAVLTEPDMP